MHIDADNGLRYAPFVQFIESIDSARAVALYRWMYPLFQQSFQELGYPNAYFNDRLVQVIDHLLQTPVPPEPVAVTLTRDQGAGGLVAARGCTTVLPTPSSNSARPGRSC